jgi:hypothetical protein
LFLPSTLSFYLGSFTSFFFRFFFIFTPCFSSLFLFYFLPRLFTRTMAMLARGRTGRLISAESPEDECGCDTSSEGQGKQ